MALSPGARLGPYEVVSALGAGGMGEVYKARDTRLDRTVAIKILPAQLAADLRFRERFAREAKAISQLSHAHICTLHDVGRHDGIDYLVMEYLEGQTLAQRLLKDALPVDQALQFAVQIADALDRAHRRGIVHRDLKPGNIMLTKSGAKLLDFGLAKANAPGGAGGSQSKLPTTQPMTAQGTILGTLHYMSPEQVEGKEADARSDIWALGAVIYEMVTGTRPFQGDTPASVIGAILKDEPPPLSVRQPLAPRPLASVVSACLAKDADERWQSAHDLKLELLSIRPEMLEVGHRAPARGRWRLTTATAVVLLALGAIGMWGMRVGSPPDEPRIQRATRLTNETGFSEWPTWSPDGKLFAYSQAYSWRSRTSHQMAAGLSTTREGAAPRSGCSRSGAKRRDDAHVANRP